MKYLASLGAEGNVNLSSRNSLYSKIPGMAKGNDLYEKRPFDKFISTLRKYKTA